MQKFTHNFSTLHYKISGSGKPVLFLHGFLEDHSIWDEIYPVFVDAGFRIILVDLPCHGLSRFDGDNCSMSQMAEIIHAFYRVKIFLSLLFLAINGWICWIGIIATSLNKTHVAAFQFLGRQRRKKERQEQGN